MPHEGEVVGITPHHTKYHAKHKMKVGCCCCCVSAKHFAVLYMCECDVKFWYELGSIELDLELKPILAVYGIKM